MCHDHARILDVFDFDSRYPDKVIRHGKITKQVDAAAALLTCILEATGSNHGHVKSYSHVL
jgi:hypothetical protein